MTDIAVMGRLGFRLQIRTIDHRAEDIHSESGANRRSDIYIDGQPAYIRAIKIRKVLHIFGE